MSDVRSDRCPTCGRRVPVVTGDDGTSYFAPDESDDMSDKRDPAWETDPAYGSVEGACEAESKGERLRDGSDVRSEGRSVLESEADYMVRLEAEVERLRKELRVADEDHEHDEKVLRELIREARSMVPHADEPSGRRNDWCARADAALDMTALPSEGQDAPGDDSWSDPKTAA